MVYVSKCGEKNSKQNSKFLQNSKYFETRPYKKIIKRVYSIQFLTKLILVYVSYLNVWWMYGTYYRWIGNDVRWLKQEVYLHYIRSQTNKMGHFENIPQKIVFMTFWTFFFKKPSLKFTNFQFFLNKRICSFDCKKNYPLSIFLRIYPLLAQCGRACYKRRRIFTYF